MSSTDRVESPDEPPLDSARVIVDPHHHLWDHGARPGVAAPRPFLLQEFVQIVADSGHRIARTVYVECRSMYRSDGPQDLRPIGETEFANGMAAMSASGRYGDCRVALGIVGTANLRLGTRATPILEAQIAAGNGRLRGVRFPTAYADTGLFGYPPEPGGKGVLLDPAFRDGVHAAGQFGLSLDVWCVQTQLGELGDLAAACPDVRIVLDHLGTPLRLDAAQGAAAPCFREWKSSIVELARRPNVFVKLGGLGMDVTAPIGSRAGRENSATLATLWQPYIETCVEAFGAGRCMLESNFPVDAATCTYGALWNAFKRILAACSESEKSALFSDTASRVYRLL